MKVKELKKLIKDLDENKDIAISGIPSHISHSNFEVDVICFEEPTDYDSEEEYHNERFIEGYVLKPKVR